jgi:hypothetical protein
LKVLRRRKWRRRPTFGAGEMHFRRKRRAERLKVNLPWCLIANIPTKFFMDIFAGSFAKKRGFSLSHADFIGAKPCGFCSAYFCK